MFNLLVHSNDGFWETPSCVFPMDRFLLGTSTELRERFLSLNDDAVKVLTSIPTLFAYETWSPAARVGWIAVLQARDEKIKIVPRFDSQLEPIGPERMKELLWDLEIEGWEASKSHWAVKGVDFFAVLRNGNSPLPTVPPYAIPVSSSSSGGVESKDLHSYFRSRSLELGEKIGDGGYGEVYRAQHQLLGVPRAVKFFSPRFYDDSDERARKRFLREAELLGRFSHAGIVRFYDAGVTDRGVPFIVSEFVEGRDLFEQQNSLGVFSFADVVEIVRQTLEALAAAHGANVFHRDIKPRNLMWHAGRVTVLDFGASGILEQGLSRMTTTAHGTPGFIDPALVDNPQLLDPRVDLYSVAVSAHKLTTGQLVSGDPGYLLSKSGAPAAFVGALRRAMGPFENRFRTAREMLAALPSGASFEATIDREIAPAIPAGTPSNPSAGEVWEWIKEQEQTRDNTLVRNMDARSKFSDEVDEMIRTACRRWDMVGDLARDERLDVDLLVTMFGNQIARAHYWATIRKMLPGDFDGFIWLAEKVPESVKKDVLMSIKVSARCTAPPGDGRS